MTDHQFDIEFKGTGEKAKNPANEAHPNGMDIDASRGKEKTCMATLPYPAVECGAWLVRCKTCGSSAAVTAAGRSDDPRSIKMPCRKPVDQRCMEETCDAAPAGMLKIRVPLHHPPTVPIREWFYLEMMMGIHVCAAHVPPFQEFNTPHLREIISAQNDMAASMSGKTALPVNFQAGKIVLLEYASEDYKAWLKLTNETTH